MYQILYFPLKVVPVNVKVESTFSNVTAVLLSSAFTVPLVIVKPALLSSLPIARLPLASRLVVVPAISTPSSPSPPFAIVTFPVTFKDSTSIGLSAEPFIVVSPLTTILLPEFPASFISPASVFPLISTSFSFSYCYSILVYKHSRVNITSIE